MPQRARLLGIRMTNPVKHWVVALSTALSVYFFMWAYHDWWRNKPYSWATANECLALAALFNLSVAQALGPLCRLSGLFLSALNWRRAFGVSAVGLAAAHVTLTFTFDSHGWAYFEKHLLLLLLGIAASGALLFLFSISYPWALKRYGIERWHLFQQFGYVALALVLAHYLVLGKVSNWLDWFEKRNLPMPPGTFPLSCLAALALLLKLLELALALRSPSPAMTLADCTSGEQTERASLSNNQDAVSR